MDAGHCSFIREDTDYCGRNLAAVLVLLRSFPHPHSCLTALLLHRVFLEECQHTYFISLLFSQGVNILKAIDLSVLKVIDKPNFT